MTKPRHGTQYPVNRTVDRSNRFGAECLYAFTWPSGGGDAFEAVNGISLAKGGAAAATVDTGPLGYGMNCSNPGDSTRDHGYPIPSSIAYTTGAAENFAVSLYGSALGGSFINLIGDESQANNAMRFRNSGNDLFLLRLDGGNETTIATTAGLTGAGAGVHLFTIVVDHDANLCLLYADGVLEGSVTIADEAFVFADLLMGFNATGFGWSGYMQEMQVFLTPTPWNAADVAAHADNFLQIYEVDIIFPHLTSVAGGGANITAESVSYAYTPTAVELQRGLNLTTESTAYTYTPSAVDLNHGRTLATESVSYSYTPTAVTLTFTPVGNFTLTTESVSYSYAATAVELQVGRVLVAESAAYNYSITNANILLGSVLVTATVPYTYSVTEANINYGRLITTDSTAYTYTVTALALLTGRVLNASSASYTYAVTDISLPSTSDPWSVQSDSSTSWSAQANVSTAWAEQSNSSTTWTVQ